MVRSPLFLTRFPLGPVEITIHAPCAICVLKQRGKTQFCILSESSANRKQSQPPTGGQSSQLAKNRDFTHDRGSERNRCSQQLWSESRRFSVELLREE